MIRYCRFWIFISSLWCAVACAAEQLPEMVVRREARTLSVRSKSGGEILSVPIGIGRGGSGKKARMSDLITPTGEFTVDLILAPQRHYFDISPDLLQKYAGMKDFADLAGRIAGLPQLFENMNSIDFDGDGAPDTAYGSAYIGLHSDRVVTGPKMRFFGSTPYWYSIALHGTPDEATNIGAANSGGCVHMRAMDLERLIDEGYVAIGSRVLITD